MDYRGYMRRRLLEQLYDKMTPEEKRTFVQLTLEDKDHAEILQALQSQQQTLEQIKQGQSWWLDFSSNIAGNAVFDGAVWLISKLFKRL